MAVSSTSKRARNRLIGRWAARYIRFVKSSSRIVSDPADPHALLRLEHPYILAMWHGQFMLLAPFSPPGLPIANMVARHGDAEIIGDALLAFDMKLVRGGGAAGRRKDRGGLHAFREAARLLENGTAIAMTADVPPGPARTAGLGIVKLAQISGRPIIPVATASSRFKTLDTWSRMTINLPFSTIGVTHGAPITVPPDADDLALEAIRLMVESGLNAATERAYELAGANAADALPHAALTSDDPPARPGATLKLYQLGTKALTPGLRMLLAYREKQGKEERPRRGERLGTASQSRPEGPLIWFHAASVGETNAVLPVMDALRAHRPNLRFLLTTGTVTSAALAKDRMATGDIHQYAPLDAPAYVAKFLDYWRPAIAALTESEIWPNTILACSERGIPMVLVNARISERSYKRWRKNRATARPLFSRMHLILAQNERLARRFRELGGRDVRVAGNLKVDSPALPVDAATLTALQIVIGARPVFFAASTHPGEDEIVLDAFGLMKKEMPELLLVLAPRHPERGLEITDLITKRALQFARRRASDSITMSTDVYVADTVGEMGLFYTLCDIVFVGGSLVERGGQNPIEAIQFSTAILTGPSQFNFADAYSELKRREGVIEVANAEEMSAAALHLFQNSEALRLTLENATAGLAAMVGALDTTTDALDRLLDKNDAHLPPPDEDIKRAS